ncbi:MAG: molybdenum cofactor synthesis protein [Elusimicrobia bacterium]|nr:molybdenum cofactor synthesis protein [Elusimicrobiota bacterium]
MEGSNRVDAAGTVGTAVSVKTSEKTGTTKLPRPSIKVDARGVVGDAHAGTGHRQVSLLAQEDVERFSAQAAGGKAYRPGDFAENITSRGVAVGAIGLLDRVLAGSVELEVSQIGKACHGKGCAIFVETGRCVMPEAGIFMRVVRGGTIRPGDRIEHRPRPLRIGIITLSDRASRGEYEDLSGPRVEELLAGFFAGKRWHPEFGRSIIPDDKAALSAALRKSVRGAADLLFTTGGTGIGPRDITPEVVEGFADKLLPGVMDYIRVKHGERLPSALLSRSVAAVKGGTLIYCLPGSVKAVSDYVPEIARTLEHSIAMLHGLNH